MQEFEQADVGARRLLVDGERLCDGSHCGHRSRSGGQVAQEHGEQIRSADVDEVGHVARDECGEVVLQPRPAPVRRANGERREATRRDALSVRRPTDAGRLERRRGVPLPESVEPCRHAGAGELGLGERAQRHSLHSPRQRVSDARREQEVRRAGDEESSGAGVAVDLGLECQHELRRALKLVDEGAIAEPCDESGRSSTAARRTFASSSVTAGSP